MKKIYSSLLAFSFAAISFAQTATQTYTSSGTYTVPTGVTSITIEVVGAGGDGGSNGGGGGGGGGYAVGTFSVSPGATLPVVVGVNGTGTVGGTTSVSTLISATGGANGSSGGVSPGGAGGTGIGGFNNYTGGNGGNGTYTYFGGGGGGAAGSTGNGTNGGNTIPWTGICLTPGGTSGTGGGTPGGDGGKGAGFADGSCTVTDPADGGSSYGGGGGGGNGIGSLAGEGSDGYVIISWCNIDVSTTTTGVTITANATSPTSYQWLDCNNAYAAIPGEDNASFTATSNGSYAVEIIDGDCTDTSACVSITTVGLNQAASQPALLPHPNPFTNKISIENATGEEEYTLTSSAGKREWSGKNIEAADFSNLAKGVYVLKIKTPSRIQTLSIIKE
ncbi:MAG TPA: T9SS type A sorting domain-containing protein [Flavobacteriales bacterium]|nr:T9SS type A sorting domain-containing protein [Flavobacteriales bacterium]